MVVATRRSARLCKLRLPEVTLLALLLSSCTRALQAHLAHLASLQQGMMRRSRRVVLQRGECRGRRK